MSELSKERMSELFKELTLAENKNKCWQGKVNKLEQELKTVTAKFQFISNENTELKEKVAMSSQEAFKLRTTAKDAAEELQSKTSKIVELEQEVKTLKATAEEELENGKRNLEEAHTRVGELEQKLEEIKNSKESEKQKLKALELALKDKEDAREQTNSANSNGKDASVETELSNNVKNQGIYCHFYNNYKSCNFEKMNGKKCQFIHQKSPKCRFEIVCSRNKCMF